MELCSLREHSRLTSVQLSSDVIHQRPTTPRMRRVFLRLSVLPPVLWAAALWYLAHLDTWGASGAAAPILLPVLGLSAALGVLGALLVWRAWRRAEPVRVQLVAAAVASVVAGYYAVRGVA